MKFKAAVKTEPANAAKGQVEAELTPHGLRILQVGKLDFALPIGTPVAYLGGNRMAVQLQNCRMELAVSKFGAFQDRLARDVAAAVSGQRPLPAEGDYVIPWYLYIPAALPLGIVVLTCGGAIPGAVSFGLASISYALIQKEDWPVAARLAVTLALAAAGYGVAIALGVAALLNRLGS